MLEMPEEKSVFNPVLFDVLRCPTKERPYLITRVNSQPNFNVTEDTTPSDEV